MPFTACDQGSLLIECMSPRACRHAPLQAGALQLQVKITHNLPRPVTNMCVWCSCLQDGPLPPCSLPSAPMSSAAAGSAISAKVLQTDGKQLAQLLLRLSELQVRGQGAGRLACWQLLHSPVVACTTVVVQVLDTACRCSFLLPVLPIPVSRCLQLLPLLAGYAHAPIQPNVLLH